MSFFVAGRAGCSALGGFLASSRAKRSTSVVAYRLALKEPKTARGKRAIAIDDDLIALLCAEREKHFRIKAGVPDGVAVTLSLVKRTRPVKAAAMVVDVGWQM